MGIFFCFPAYATHIIGAEITYECLGNNNYRITLDVYRDCNPGNAPFDDPAQLAAFTEAGVYIPEMNQDLTMPILSKEILPNNISNDPCLIPPPNVCVERARYQKIVKLTRPGGIYIVYQRCCRNGTITNIVDPLNTGSTYFVYISPESRTLCNNSPKFDFYPPIYVCVNKLIEHDHAATDTINSEYDSLAYKLYTPFIGATFAMPDPPGYQMSPPLILMSPGLIHPITSTACLAQVAWLNWRLTLSQDLSQVTQKLWGSSWLECWWKNTVMTPCSQLCGVIFNTMWANVYK